MFQSLLTQDNINHLNVNSDISIPLEVKGFQGIKLQNITPFYFNVTDSNGVVILYIEPWQKIEEEIPLDKITYTFNSMCNNRPQVQNNSAPSSTWAIIYELTMTPLDSKSEPITISNASNVNINGTVGVNLQGTNSVNIGTLPTVDLNNQTQVGINNAVQTLTLVDLGSTDINVSELANGHSVTAMISGLATGYFKTLILEGTSKNGYTYTATASAFNRSSNVGTPTLTQSNGTNGEFYASGSLANDQAFSNVQVSLQANVSSPSTIFQDPITSLTNWKVDSGSATAGTSGTTFGANGTVIEETSQTGLVPQNLTLQGQFAVQNTSVTNTANSNVGQFTASATTQSLTQNGTTNGTPGYTYGESFVVNNVCKITGLSFYTGTANMSVTIYLWDNSGNILASQTATTNASGYTSVTFPTSVSVTAGTTYWGGFYCSSANTANVTFGYTNSSAYTLTAGAVTFSINGTYYYRQSQGFVGGQLSSAGNLQFEISCTYQSPYDTSGNGGRKIVALSNGWLVAGVLNTSTGVVYLQVSKDNGTNWSQLCYASNDVASSFALASNGTNVYLLVVQSNTTSNIFYAFNATTVTLGALTSTGNIDTGQTSFGSGCSIAVDSSGNLYAVWCSKNSTYPNSFNLRYSKSTNGGSTWATVTQITSINTSGQDMTNPCIILNNSNNPVIINQYASSSLYDIRAYVYSGTAWNGAYTVYSGSTYNQSNPCACVDHNGTIHVTWQGEDSTYTSANQIKYANSTNGGSSWSTTININPQSSGGQTSPTITVDQNNKLYIVYVYGNATLVLATSTNFTNWATSTLLSDTCTNPQTLYPTTLNFSSPLVIYMDSTTNETAFKGTWTIGSHSTVSTHYRQDANDYYKVEWNAGQLNLIKVSGGTQSTLATANVNETATSVTLSLVVANNGNLTATLKGASTTQITATDTAITSGVLALGGDQNVVATNAFISGNYVPSDVVTVKAYAVA